jgi:hypothetical protein
MAQPSNKTIQIFNGDDRPIENFRLWVEFNMDGSAHADYEDHGSFSDVIYDVLDDNSGTWDGNRWTGNYLWTAKRESRSQYNDEFLAKMPTDDWSKWAESQETQPFVRIENRHKTPITNLRIAASFTISGNPHYAFEDIGDFNSNYVLNLNAHNATWDGSKWTGKLLSLVPPDTQSSSEIMILDIFYVIMVLFSAGAGGGYGARFGGESFVPTGAGGGFPKKGVI